MILLNFINAFVLLLSIMLVKEKLLGIGIAWLVGQGVICLAYLSCYKNNAILP
jgi:hypothetical protein